MDFIRNLFTLFQRLQEIVRDGQKRGDIPGMVMSLMREVRGGSGDEDGQGDGPAVYQGKRAQADQATPEAASRATARNKAARNTDLPEPAVYRSADGGDSLRDIETARAPARNADAVDERFPKPAAAAVKPKKGEVSWEQLAEHTTVRSAWPAPGLTTTRSASRKVWRRWGPSSSSTPSRSGPSGISSRVSTPTTAAPSRTQARAAARPDAPSPTTTTRAPARADGCSGSDTRAISAPSGSTARPAPARC